MTTSKWARGAAAVLAATAGACVPCAVGAQTLASGGTITFAGAIVAPSFGFAATPVTRHSQGFRTERSMDPNASAIDVTFTPAPDTPTAAQVSVFVNTEGGIAAPRTLTTRFSDNARHLAQTGAAFSMGRAGGTLSIESGAAAERAVTVMLSYD